MKRKYKTYFVGAYNHRIGNWRGFIVWYRVGGMIRGDLSFELLDTMDEVFNLCRGMVGNVHITHVFRPAGE